jgi:hypothetical protein
MTVHVAAARAARFLIGHQSPEGWWRDYDDLPVGASDGWVTAYAGRALAGAALSGIEPAAAASARRAAAWLRDVRAYPAGWGYNARTGPDADSTAHAIALLRACEMPVAPADVAWLRARFRANGGCATYDRQDAWGVAHIDVTPVAFLALPDAARMEIASGVRGFIETCRDADGTWPAYWWRTCHYSTYWNLRALATLEERSARTGHEPDASADSPPGILHPTRQVESAFDLAFAVGASALADRPFARQLRCLLRQQHDDGSWPGAANLRVTHPSCFRPWETPIGSLYVDTRRLLTTASVLLVLCATARARH